MIKSINLVLDNGDEIELSYDEAIRLYKALRELFDGKVPKDVVYRGVDENFNLGLRDSK